MAHLVNKNRDGKTERELPAEDGPVNPEKGQNAEQEFNFEQQEDRRLRLEQKQRHRSKWSEPLGPAGLGIFLGLQPLIDCRDVLLNAGGLAGIFGQPGQGGAPAVAGLGPLLFLLQLLRGRRQRAQVLAVGEGVAIGAGKRSIRQPVLATRAAVDGDRRREFGR